MTDRPVDRARQDIVRSMQHQFPCVDDWAISHTHTTYEYASLNTKLVLIMSWYSTSAVTGPSLTLIRRCLVCLPPPSSRTACPRHTRYHEIGGHNPLSCADPRGPRLNAGELVHGRGGRPHGLRPAVRRAFLCQMSSLGAGCGGCPHYVDPCCLYCVDRHRSTLCPCPCHLAGHY